MPNSIDAHNDGNYNGGLSVAFTVGIAWRHLSGRLRQTLVAMLGTIVGGTVFALMIALTDGQRTILREQLVETSAHITLKPERLEPLVPHNLLADAADEDVVVELSVRVPPTERRELKPYNGLMSRISASSPHVSVTAPFVLVPGVLRNGTRYRTVRLHGVDTEREQHVGRAASSMQWGSFRDLARSAGGVLIGRDLADALGVTVGDETTLVLPSGDVQQLRVAGIFNTGVPGIDEERGYINLSLAHGLKKMSRIAVSGISIQVDDIDRVEEVRQRIEASTGYRAETWEEVNSQVLGFQERQALTAQGLVVLIFIIAAFGIANSLAAVVLQKKDDIAVMKAFGVSRRGVIAVFLLEGMLIGTMGGLIAAVVSYVLAWFIADLGVLPQLGGGGWTRPGVVPLSRDLSVYLFTFAISIVIASLASMMPARRAARYVPVRILRGDG